jgi:hypothetical protein
VGEEVDAYKGGDVVHVEGSVRADEGPFEADVQAVEEGCCGGE